MYVLPCFKSSHHPGFGQSTPVGQYKVVKNNETGSFEPYDGNEDKPKFSKIINGKPGRIKLQEATQAIGEYVPYYEKKQEYFARWICNYYQKNLKKNSSFKLPSFICFGSRLADALSTPCIYKGEWDFHAARFLDSIFLWADPKYFQHHLTTKLKYGFAFESLMTGLDPATLPADFMATKQLAVHEKKFGEFSLLLVSDIDAEDDEGNWVELKIYEERFVNMIDQKPHPLDKTLRCWSQCVVSDSKRVIIGQHTQGCLSDNIIDCDLPNFEMMVKISKAQSNLCYEFLNRLLAFIRKQFEQSSEGCCLQFSWNSKDAIYFDNGQEKYDRKLRKVKCVQVPAQEFPEWFTEMCKILKQNVINGSAYSPSYSG